MRSIVVIAHNIRSTHNIGAIFRTCDGLGIDKLIISGYSSYPAVEGDPRLPHIATKLTNQIHKSALGAELTVPFDYHEEPDLAQLRSDGYTIIGLEQTSDSVALKDYRPTDKVALILGEEVDGISSDLLEACDVTVEIPMYGQKESFNVSVAAGIALYHLRVS